MHKYTLKYEVPCPLDGHHNNSSDYINSICLVSSSFLSNKVYSIVYNII